MKKTAARQVLARNLGGLMRQSEKLRTQTQVGDKSGVGQTTVSLMLRPESDTIAAPKLDTIENVAAAFGLEAWQLLLNEDAVGPRLYRMLTRPEFLEERAEQRPRREPVPGEIDISGAERGSRTIPVRRSTVRRKRA